MTDELRLSDVGFDSAEVTVELSIDHLARLARLLDIDPLAAGQPLPLLWHWCCFTPTVPTSQLGPDGHPRPSDALRTFPRRMWGAGSVTVTEPLVAGEPATRHSELLSTKRVSGGSGDLLIVQVGHRYSQRGAHRLDETQTIIYRTPGDPIPLPEGNVEPPDETGAWRRSVTPDERLLFRASAVTFNTHRIHYDLPYTRDVEGYPALVVQGPLSAMLIALGATEDAGAALRAFSFRATNPLFAGQRFTITGRRTDEHGTAEITRTDGAHAMEANYTL